MLLSSFLVFIAFRHNDFVTSYCDKNIERDYSHWHYPGQTAERVNLGHADRSGKLARWEAVAEAIYVTDFTVTVYTIVLIR